MSTHVLLNLLNNLRKVDKMQGLLSILFFFHKNFNKFKTGVMEFLISIQSSE